MFIRNLLNSHSSWLVSIITLSIVTTPLLANNRSTKKDLLEHFNRLEEKSPEAKQALIDGYNLLENLVQDINTKYNYSLTLKDAGVLVKSNLAKFELPSEAKASLLALIDFIELVDSEINDDLSFLEMSASYIQLGFLPAIFQSFRLDKKSLQKNLEPLPLQSLFLFHSQVKES